VRVIKRTGERNISRFLVTMIPMIGPLKVLQLRTPMLETERMFKASFNVTLDRYCKLLGQVYIGQPDLPSDNFGTGEITGPGKYRLNDETHAKLLDALARQNFSDASPGVRTELLEFYLNPDAAYAAKQKPKGWAKVQVQLEQLKQAASPAVTGVRTILTLLRGCNCDFGTLHRTVRPTLKASPENWNSRKVALCHALASGHIPIITIPFIRRNLWPEHVHPVIRPSGELHNRPI
jgi:hypothetical protein